MVDTADPRAARAGALGGTAAGTPLAGATRDAPARATGTPPVTRGTWGVCSWGEAVVGIGVTVAGIGCAERAGVALVGHGTRSGSGGRDADCLSRASRGLTAGARVLVPRATTVAADGTRRGNAAASRAACRGAPGTSRRATASEVRRAGDCVAGPPALSTVERDRPAGAVTSRSRGAIGAGRGGGTVVGLAICGSPRR